MRSRRRAESGASRREWNRYTGRRITATILSLVIGFFGLGMLGGIAAAFSTTNRTSDDIALAVVLGLFYAFIAVASLYSLQQWVKRADPENPEPPRSARADLRRLFGIDRETDIPKNSRSLPLSDERRLWVLKALVEAFIETGQPVPVSVILERTVPAISPTTLEDDLSHLTAERLVEPASGSAAGRVPTHQASRYYIDRVAPKRQRSFNGRRNRPRRRWLSLGRPK